MKSLIILAVVFISLLFANFASAQKGNIYAWGDNTVGQLGIGSTTNQYTPQLVNTPYNLTTYNQGAANSVGIDNNGFVYGAGNANLGMTGTFTVPTLTSLTNIVKVLSGSSAVIALKSDGTLWCSGTNTGGECGQGNTNAVASFTQIPVPVTVTDFSLHHIHVFAIGSDKSVWVWGAGTYGRLGLGNQNNQYTPILHTVLSSMDLVQVAACYHTGAAITKSGDVYTWGRGGTGSNRNCLGSSDVYTPTLRTFPGNVPMASVSCSDHMLFISKNTSLYSCGVGSNGQLGTGGTNSVATPGRVSNLFWSEVVALRTASIGLTADGTLYTWGANKYAGISNTNGNQVTIATNPSLTAQKFAHVYGSQNGAALQATCYTPCASGSRCVDYETCCEYSASSSNITDNPSSVAAGISTLFKISMPKCAYNNTVSIVATGVNTANVITATSTFMPATNEFTISTTVLDTYNLVVFVNGIQSVGSPFQFSVVPGPPSSISFGGTGYPTATITVQTYIDVTIRDVYGNAHTSDSLSLYNNSTFIDFSYSSFSNGTYRMFLTYYRDGANNVSIAINYQASVFVWSFSVTVTCMPTDFTQSIVSIPTDHSNMAGATSYFRVFTKVADGSDQLCFGNADTFTATLVGPVTITNVAFSRVPGTPNNYTATFLTYFSGDFDVSVSSGAGDPLSIFTPSSTLHVYPGATLPSKSIVSEIPRIDVNTFGNFTITTFDSYNNFAFGGDNVTVTVYPVLSPPWTIQIIDENNGNYTVVFMSPKPGNFLLTPTVNGYTLLGSYVATITAAGGITCNGTDAVMSDVFLNITEIFAGEHLQLDIVARDASGNVQPCPFSYSFFVQVTNDDPSVNFGTVYPQVLQDINSTSQFSVSYALIVAGSYTIRVTLNNADVDLSPYTFDVLPGATHPPTSDAFGPGLDEFNIVDEPTSFTIQPKDLYGNNVTSGNDTVIFRLIALHSDIDTGYSTTNNPDGSYLVSYTSPKDGYFGGKLYLNSEISQYQIARGFLIKFACNPTVSKTSYIPADSTNIRSGQEVVAGSSVIKAATINTRGNSQTCSEDDDVRVMWAKAPSSTLTTAVMSRENAEGNLYSYSLPLTTTGLYQIRVLVNNQSISNDTFSVTVVPGETDPSNSKLSGSLTSIESFLVGTKEQLNVELRDSFGNSITKQGNDQISINATVHDNSSGKKRDFLQTEFVGEIEAASASTDASDSFDVSDPTFSNGKYSISVEPKKKGTFDLAVYVNGVLVQSFSGMKTNSPPPNPAGAIAGSVIGVAAVFLIILLIIIIIVVVIIVLRYRKKVEERKPPNFSKLVYGPFIYKPEADLPAFNALALQDLLLQDEMKLVLALEDCIERQPLDEFCRSIVYTFADTPHAVDVIRYHIQKEIRLQDNSGTLFRNNGGATKTMNYFTLAIGLEYMYNTLHQTIVDCIQNASSTVEVDASKLSKDEDVNLNRWTLMASTQKTLLAIIKSCDTMPRQMREISKILQDECMKKFDDSRHTSVGGYVFLRFFCPGLTSPVSYGLTKTKPSDSAARMLVLICKALQNLANGIEFGGKERHMVQINELVTQNLEKVQQFFDSIAATPESSQPGEIVTMPKDVKPRALACIFQNMLTYRDTLEAALKNNPRVRDRFIAFMEDPAAENLELLERSKSSKGLKGKGKSSTNVKNEPASTVTDDDVEQQQEEQEEQQESDFKTVEINE